MELSIWIGIAACLIGAYFAACNMALKGLSRSRLSDVLDDRGQSDRLGPFLSRLTQYQLVTGMMRASMGLVVVLSALYCIENQQLDWPRYGQHLLAFVVAGILVSLFIVAIPASWARYHREALVARSLPVLRITWALLYPLAALLHLIDPVMRRIFGTEVSADDSELSDEVLSVVEDHERGHVVDEVQKEMLEAVFELPNTTAAEVMTPRTDMKGIDIKSCLEEVKASVIAMGHSRIPVYQESLDHIIGILYVKDLIAYIGDGGASGEFDLNKVLRSAFMVPESKSVRELLAEFKGRKVHMAIVLDEYGGTAGLITIEDIIEEIVGDIQDEYEVVEDLPQLAQVDENTAEVDARMHIDDFNDALDVELPEDEDYDTLGGFVFAQLGHIPHQGESFEFETLKFTVLEAERTKVKRVKVEKLEVSPSTPANGQ